MKDRIRYLREVIEQLLLQNALLEERSSPQQVFNHHYPAQMMALAVFIVLHGGLRYDVRQPPSCFMQT